MKKIVLVILFIATALMGVKAQDGVTTSFAFGGGMTAVDEMRYASDGNLYFLARLGGKNLFAGNNYDAGSYGSYPLQQCIYGKISTSGQQTLLKTFERNAGNNNIYNSLGGNHVIDKDGNLFSIITGTFPGNDYGNGFIETGYGAKMIKTSNTGVVQWIKPIDTGVNISYGDSGTTLPNVSGMQVMDDGSIYIIIASNYKPVSGNYTDKFGTRIIKYNNNGDEVWHHEIFGTGNSLSFVVSAPKQFVTNNGSLMVNITANSPTIISNEVTLTATNPTSYGSYYFCLMGLDSNGERTWFHATTLGAGFKAVDPASGTAYVTYTYSGSNSIPPPIAPYSSLPNLNPIYGQFNNYNYLYSGMLKLDITTGGIINSTPTSPASNRFLNNAEKLHVRSDGSLIFYGHRTTFSAIGDYLVPDNYNAIIFTNANYNISKVSQANIDKVELIAESSTNFAFADDFKIPIILGGNTLTPFLVDTDFGTRFPSFAYSKADSYIAQGTINQIGEPKTTKWTGALSTAWNDAGNWSNGLADINTTAIFDANTVNQPSVAAATTVGRVVINNGITATLPASNLIIKDKLEVNGTLKILVSGFTYFTGYNAGAIEGNGTIEFYGTGSATMAYVGTLSKQLGLKTNVNLSAGGTYKTVEFIGEAVKITGDLTIANTNANAISGAGTSNYIVGKLTQNIVAGTVYTFPVGTASYYLPVSINTNTLSEVNNITVSPKTNNPAVPDLNISGGTVNRFSNNGIWAITTDAVPISGTYSITLNKNNATNGDADANKYLILKTKPANSVYAFEGSLGNRSQTGGTGTSPNFQNSAISVSQGDLDSFGEFGIAVMSGAISQPLAITASTWTGTTNTDWNNSGNWSNGVPSSTVNAVIPSGLANYPLIYNQTKSYLNNLTIDAGVNVNLSDRLLVVNEIKNNGIITVNTTANANSALPVRALLNGNGKVVFLKTKVLTDAQTHAGNINCDVEVNIGDANSININGMIGGNVKIISGMPVNTLSNGEIIQLDPNVTLEITAPINHIVGRITKSVSSNGMYNFPIGNYLTSPYNGGRKYGAITITNHDVANTSQYQVWFDGSTTGTYIPQKKGSDIYSSFLNSGYWWITPNVVSTSGTIDLVLKTSNYTNGKADISDYALIRANDAGYWTFIENAVFSENAGIITVTANGLAPLSTTGATRFYIGLKATTTTWTGQANNGNWNTAGNWSSGVPNTTTKAIFNGSATNFPTTNIPTSNAPAAVEIQSGATLSLPTSFSTPIPMINNGTIEVKGTGTFVGFGNSPYTIPSGSGTLKFTANSPNQIYGAYLTNSTIPNAIEIANPAGVTVYNSSLNLGGSLIFTSGKLTVAPNYTLNMTNPNATITGASTSSYIIGNVNRTVNSAGNYTFPVGTATAYAPAVIQLNNIVGPTSISASFNSTALSNQPNLSVGSATITQALAGGSWTIIPNIQPTSGNYNITLSAPLGSSTANDFAIIKREDNYAGYPWTVAGTPQSSSVNAGMVTAVATGITSFSQFGLGEVVGVLPVKLTKFLASADAKFAKLYWETASELNNDKFEIERSTNGKDFIRIGKLKGNGTSQKLNAYSFKDLAPTSGLNYYRLKQVDFNGHYEYSETRTVKFDLMDLVFRVYPNPATEIINFSETVKSVDIYTLSGAKVYEQTTTACTVNIPSAIKPGVYIVKAILLNGLSVTKQVIIK
ncbi:MAG TPA: T9SS type A sorting domain-containing protein [Pelobium sp.]